jgi:hypothetical protein
MDRSRDKAVAPHLPRLPSGIDGFDNITDGGLPLHRISIFIGNACIRKTVFILPLLANKMKRWNARRIFVAFQQKTCNVLSHAVSFGWPLEILKKKNKLYFLDARQTADVANSGSNKPLSSIFPFNWRDKIHWNSNGILSFHRQLQIEFLAKALITKRNSSLIRCTYLSNKSANKI